MARNSVAVPASILLARDLTASAKLIWVYLRFDIRKPEPQVTEHEFARALANGCSGLTPPTIRRALSELANRGLLWTQPGSPHASQDSQRRDSQRQDSQRRAWLPADLLADAEIGTCEKLVYGVLQLSPGFSDSEGQYTYADLSDLSGISVNALKPAISTLHDGGWLRAAQSNRRSPIRFGLCNPMAERCQGMIAGIKARLKDARHDGEALMREYLSLVVDSDKYQDNARPAFLRNPFSSEIMELDRLYHQPDVAWEFNGPQHYRPTVKYPGKTKAEKQRARDFIKAGICAGEGIELLVVHAGDLTLATIREKAGALLPMRNLAGLARVIDYLEEISWTYRLTADNS